MKRPDQRKFDITRRGEIYVIRFAQEWILDDAKTFFAAYKETVKRDRLKKFGVLSDMRLLLLGTPEAVEFFQGIGDWAQRNGQVGRAQLLSTGYEEFLVQRIDTTKNRFPARSFETEDEALAWLTSLGLSVS